MAEQQAPLGSPGDILNWPMLKIEYRTDAAAIAKLLPPGFTVGKEPIVYLTVYSFPVLNEPEYGCVITVAADYDGVEGQYALSYAIDQEDAIYVSREHWGQPKFLADITYFRLMDNIIARVTHAGHTFLEYTGAVASTEGPGDEFEINEWWVKSARDVSMAEGKFDYPP
ncbi:MAG: acetoacetate decarboxylase family protein, partial [Pseudomonadales bacterium]